MNLLALRNLSCSFLDRRTKEPAGRYRLLFDSRNTPRLVTPDGFLYLQPLQLIRARFLLPLLLLREQRALVLDIGGIYSIHQSPYGLPSLTLTVQTTSGTDPLESTAHNSAT